MSESNETDILMNGEQWFAKNWGMLLNITLVILVVVVGVNWVRSSKSASSSAAESALINALSSDSTNQTKVALLLHGVHTQYKGEPVAERALILSANTSLEAGDYQNAQTRFAAYLSEYADGGNWIDEARLGQAVSQEAQGKSGEAQTGYQSLTNNHNAVIKARAVALLEAAKTELAPLPSRPEPVVEPQTPSGDATVPTVSTPEVTPAAPVPPPAAPDQK
tara:strand:+ start:264 stop:926 length:663 start_codon:yes stop_codon:yes gene_type:complete